MTNVLLGLILITLLFGASAVLGMLNWVGFAGAILGFAVLAYLGLVLGFSGLEWITTRVERRVEIYVSRRFSPFVIAGAFIAGILILMMVLLALLR